MNDLRAFYIQKDNYYLQHFNLETEPPHYTMVGDYNYRYTTDDLEEIKSLNELVKGTILASNGCDIPCVNI